MIISSEKIDVVYIPINHLISSFELEIGKVIVEELILEPILVPISSGKICLWFIF